MKDKLKKIRNLIDEVLKDLEHDQISRNKNEFEDLKNLLFTNEWPEAVFETHIADENSEIEKDDRAEGIADMLLPPLSGKRFLDFGCGEGHVANYASKSALFSVGYDRIKSERSRFVWEEDVNGILLTTNFDSVRSKGPYDIVLLYDVLDHSQDVGPKEILEMVSSVLADGGKIYLRTHPWCSRHGGHLYRKMNKAFVHIVFTEDELKEMGLNSDCTIKVLTPVDSYSSWIKDSGLKNSAEPVSERQEVEPFFGNNPAIRRRILKLFGKDEWSGACPEWQMSQSFWDYVLEK